ncbi:MAG TPA: acyl-ACP--UDP-N-acetylglucosamine O-acyltransferase [Gemmatimonadaceae bacterium]|jgi:UDP-N-acetylglucosamine acyltransferase|nr:acyl-ACP--UDP-N-acetylglucosamine O-acyltransferase [Gemmatimonadaceae bacterium]
MTAKIHPSAIVSSSAEIGDGVEIGPFAIVGDDCVIGDGCVISARASLERYVILGRNVKIGVGTVLGSDPQDLKFKGERTTVEIGDNTVVREYSTINRGTSQSFKTSVGANSFVMSYVHLAHDCHIGEGVVLANMVQLAGHVTVEDRVILSGVTAVHQFTRIGRNAIVGGCSRVSKDVPPFVKAVGNPMKLYGLNSVGLRRNGFTAETILELKRAYRLLFRSELNLAQAVERVTAEVEQIPEVRQLVQFVESSQRGVAI